MNRLGADRVSVTTDFMQEGVKLVAEVRPELKKRYKNFIKTIESHCFREASQVFHEIFSHTEKLAKDLEKENPQIVVNEVPCFFTLEGEHLLSNVFVHLVRNSLDHGIESAEDRKRSGKKIYGTLSVNISVNGSDLMIVYEDDGAGLDLDVIRKKAVATGVLSSEESDPQMIANSIFSAGLSTAEATSEISGRGVGMDAIRSYLDKVGCSIDLKIKPFQADGSQRAHASFHIKLNEKFFIVKEDVS